MFQDGVRINEAFGDVVNWDLLPRSAISSVQLIPGSNPVFGLNTLGGALAIYTKSGAQYPGGAVELSGGSFGRRTLELEYGGQHDRLSTISSPAIWRAMYGWAEHNASRVKQFFGKVGYQDEASPIWTFQSDAGRQHPEWYANAAGIVGSTRRSQAYTFPDVKRKSARLHHRQRQPVPQRFGVLLGGNLYLRHYRNANVSSNVNGDYGKASMPIPASCRPTKRPTTRSAIDQKGWGFGLQLTLQATITPGLKNQFIAGFSGDFGDTTFTQAVATGDLYVQPMGTRSAAATSRRSTDVGIAQSLSRRVFVDTLPS